MTTEKRQHQRYIKNYLLNPRMQLRMTMYFIVFGFAIMGAMTFIFYNQIQRVDDIISSISGMPIEQQIELGTILSNLVKICLIFFLIFLVSAGFYGLLISHRIAGPMYAILAYIEELKKGNYDSKRNLRDYDELQPIMASLKELAAGLKK